MKRIVIYFSAALSLLAVSCTRIEPDPREPGNGTGLAIDLGVLSADAVPTKADKSGVSDLNENKIYTLDYFLYKVNPSTNTSTDAFLAGRLVFDGIEPTTDALAEANAQVIDLDAYYNLEDENKNCYAYVIANLPDSFTWTDGTLYSGTTAVGTTWADLQAIEVVAGFKESLTEGKFKAQDSFVMTGLNSQTLSGKGADLLIVDLSRVAAKITLDLDVVKLFDKYEYNTMGSFSYRGSYFPNIDKIQVYLSYVDETGVISGAPSAYDNNFITYTRNAYVPTVTDSTYVSKVIARDDEGNIITDGSGNPTYVEGAPFPSFDVQGTPFYSYPIKWNVTDTHAPFIKIIIPWVKYDVPEGLRMQYTTFNNVNHTVDLDPTKDAYKDLVGAVVGKAATARTFPNAVTVATGDASYNLTRLTSDAALASRYGDEYYYKINIPVENYRLASNNWYMIKLDISVLGSESDDAKVVIDGSSLGIYVVDWSTPLESIGGDLENGRYLSTVLDEYTFDAVNSIDIPVISSHTLAASIISRQQWRDGAWQTPRKWNANRNQWDEDNTRGEVTTSGTDLLTLTNVLTNTMGRTLDCYKFKFVVEISQVNSDGSATGTLKKRITIYQYPSIYIDGIAGGNAFVDGYYGNVNGNAHAYPGNHGTANGATWTPYAPIANSVSATDQTDMTVISISSLANSNFTLREYRRVGGNDYDERTYPYILIDPRENAGYGANSLIAYYNGRGTSNWTDAHAGAIKRASSTEKSYIAPKIMISSRWGRMGNWHPEGGNTGQQQLNDAQRYEVAQKRCATYQEAGYPAGRWRLPTPAEIAFIANLQRYQLIKDLFTSTGYSISSTGDIFTVSGNNVNVNHEQGTSCRCVYDLWYWGDEPVAATNSYTVKPNL